MSFLIPLSQLFEIFTQCSDGAHEHILPPQAPQNKIPPIGGACGINLIFYAINSGVDLGIGLTNGAEISLYSYKNVMSLLKMLNHIMVSCPLALLQPFPRPFPRPRPRPRPCRLTTESIDSSESDSESLLLRFLTVLDAAGRSGRPGMRGRGQTVS